jgi:tRNA pseudouridine55 synthase
LDGIILLDKPLGMSSNRASQTVKRLLKASKAGHVGSLDPLATGMLPICLGEATKIAGEILSGHKAYQFTVKLGARTATGDLEGLVVESAPVPALTESLIQAVLKRFTGPQSQIPPMYSALKKDGQPLYKLARAGLTVERAARPIEIFELSARGFAADTLELTAVCSKGTYIRTLAEDLASALGTCGHLTYLRRLYVEPFENEPLQTLEEVGRQPKLLPADRGVPQIPAVRLPAEAAARLIQGQTVQIGEEPRVCGKVRVYDGKGRFLGIGESDGLAVKPRRLFVEPLVGVGPGG